MKFKIHHFQKLHGRLGSIYAVERLPSFTLDTPNMFFYTQGGCIPHLTYDVLQKITTDNIPMQYPLNNIYNIVESVNTSRNALHSFVGQPEYVAYCCLQDPLYMFPQGRHRLQSATIRCTGGFRFITSNEYMDIMESFQPDIYVSSYDCDTSISSSNKRVSNSVSITNNMFQKCYERHIISPVLKNKGLIAPVCGGYDLLFRETCARFVSSFSVLGYLIDGFFQDGRCVDEIPIEEVKKVILHTVNFLPDERLRIIHGAWDPYAVLQMVKAGIDIFDSSFPIINAENGRALLFNFNVPNLLDDGVNLQVNSEFCENKKNELFLENGKTESVNHAASGDNARKAKPPQSNYGAQTSYTCDNPFSVSLRDARYFDDLKPIMENCECLTCRKHTRAYIHHLLCTKELLAPVLLTIHNLHHYIQFFNRIREDLRKQFK